MTAASSSRVDLAYPEALIAIEADSYRWHSSPQAWSRDVARNNTLTSLGWVVLHFTWQQVTEQPDVVTKHVRRALARRGARQPP